MRLALRRMSIACGKVALSVLALPIAIVCGVVCGAVALIGVTIGFPVYGLMVLWEDGLQ